MEEIKWNHIKCSIKIKEGRRKRKRKRNNKFKEQNRVTNIVDINLTIPIVTFNVNYLNIPIEREKLSEWVKKKKI